MTVVVAIEAVVIAVLTVLVAGLLRSHADILRRLHDLGAGEGSAVASAPVVAADVASPRCTAAAATDIFGMRPDGAAVGVSLIEGTTLLAFLSSGCSTCAQFWKRLAADPDLPRGVRLVIVTQGADHESPAAVEALAPPGVFTVMSSQAYADFAVEVSPYFILVDRGRVVGEGASRRWSQMRGLIGRALADANSGDRPVAARSGPERMRDTDAELLAAGITPNHESLYHNPDEGQP